MQNNHINLVPLCTELSELAETRWTQLTEHPDFSSELKNHKQWVKHAYALSDFVFEQTCNRPQWLHQLLVNQQLFIAKLDFANLLQLSLKNLSDEASLHQALRHFRNFHMVRIAWRDLLNLQSIQASLPQVSSLAIELINQANDWLYQSLTPRFGKPQGEHGPQPLIILGMGKLGGGELNFSSDIDLIFTYANQGETQGGRKSIEHQQFFIKLAQKLITALNQITADGQVFRVDMRLRPFGESGPLVMHFAAMEDYYQEQGRDWERYAMLKARILNTPDNYTEELASILRPFVYRRYLDFGAIESLRTMKNMIQQEVRRRGLVNNIKLGQGGIREAEFVVQSLQLINGGRAPSLQVQSLQQALNELVRLEILPQEGASKLLHSYLWMRKVEHCLQQFADKQTQLIPETNLDRARLIHVLGYSNFDEFMQALSEHHNTVHEQFLLLVKEETPDSPQLPMGVPQLVTDLWHLDLSAEEMEPLFTQLAEHYQLAFDRPDYNNDFYNQYLTFKNTLRTKRIGQKGLSILNHLMPLVFHLIWSGKAHHHITLQNRVLTVIQAIVGRTAYLQLLWENQGALSQLIRLCDASPWVSEQIARFPLLLDELLNPATLYHPVESSQYADELRQGLLRVEPEDLELQIETLRQFKLSQQLKTAAADISNALPVMQVSDHLTYLAETIIHQVVDLAWHQMSLKHGVPCCETKGLKDTHNKGFAVIGYGKMGGWELGYGSDLDLVFLHDCNGNLPTNGDKPIESSRFYLKLAQRILHIFTIKTGLGWLYEVDMRLRPSGNSGLLVCHINGYIKYQQQDAWTWEHQAICRARFISGSESLLDSFNALRLQVLSMPREHAELGLEVVKMREKMRDHLAKGNEEKIDLKQDQGGIADIEFIVQFMLLAHTKEHPQLVKWTDNVRVLKDLAKLHILTEQESQQLSEAYLTYRNQSHRLALQNAKLANKNATLIQHQQQVVTIWQKYLGIYQQ